MKCTSCQVEIDPKWKHALKNNICPSCGDIIVPEDLRNYIDNLSGAINDFSENYSDQLDDWLYSNFNYVKIGSEKFKKLMPGPEVRIVYKSRGEAESEDEEEDSNLVAVQPQSVTSKFFQNAEVSKTVARTHEFKKMVSDIKSKNPKLAAKQTIQLLQEEDDGEISEYNDTSDISSSLDRDYSEDIPAAVLAFANKNNKNNKQSDYSLKDTIRLQQLMDKSVEARNNVINGTGGKGSFSRG